MDQFSSWWAALSVSTMLRGTHSFAGSLEPSADLHWAPRAHGSDRNCPQRKSWLMPLKKASCLLPAVQGLQFVHEPLLSPHCAPRKRLTTFSLCIRELFPEETGAGARKARGKSIGLVWGWCFGA